MTKPFMGQTVRVVHVFTIPEGDKKSIVVHCDWPQPFANLNYTISWAIEDKVSSPLLNLLMGDIHDVTVFGFDLLLSMDSGVRYPQVGSTIIIHAMGVLD